MTTADVEKYADAVYPGLAPNFVTWAESYRWPACRREPNLAEALLKHPRQYVGGFCYR